MSELSSVVTTEHFRYLAARTIQEDDFLHELKAEARSADIPAIWIAPEQGSFIQILLRLCRAREVVEIGTLAGYSAIWMARALPADGQVRTVEISSKHADFARKWTAKSDVAGRIKIYHGAARDILPKFASGSADAALVDADKANYPYYLKECLRIVRPGGLIMADNAFAFGELFDATSRDADVARVRAFYDAMAQENGLQGIIVPVGDGLWVAVKL